MDRKLKRLVRGLRQREAWHSREASARAIGQLGPAAEPAVPALCRTLEDDNEAHVRMAVVRALSQIGSREAIPFLLDATDDPSWWVRAGAELALEEIRPAAEASLGWPRTDALGG